MTDPDYDIPDDLIVTEGAPNPYEDSEGPQDDESEQQEGLGGDTLPESELDANTALKRLHDLAVSNATVDWFGQEMKAYCLRVQRGASLIGPLHTDAQQDCDDNPDKHACTLDTVEWSKVPRGAFVYFSGYAHGHIARFAGMHKGRALIVSTDVIPGQVGYVVPEWFLTHWGMPLQAWSRACNNTWQKGLDGNEPPPPPKQHQPQHKNLDTGYKSLMTVIGAVDQALEDNKDNPKFIAAVHPVRVKLGEARRELYPQTH